MPLEAQKVKSEKISPTMMVPDVSVVMSVFNGAAALPATLESILGQKDSTFEFIVVNDGSTDDSGVVLDQWAQGDARLRVIHQTNTGLTRALIRGCAEAKGEFIARQDCGDVSLPGRLTAQLSLLRRDSDVVMVACAAEFVGPAGELLYVLRREGSQLQAGLERLDLEHLAGPPHHGGTMFRRSAYEAAGGYRAPFVVAQDIDLWLRLAERGQCVGQSDVHYRAGVDAGSISARRRDEQFRLADLAIECARSRRSGISDEILLEAAGSPVQWAAATGPISNAERARHYYFLGACLRGEHPVAARRYFWRALRAQPLHVKALWRTVWG